MNNRKAFTLVEALVVVAIIGIMVTVALPAFARFYQMFKFRTAMNQLVTDVRGARQAAITNARPVKITFIDLAAFPEIRGMTGGYAVYMLATPNEADMASKDNWEEIALHHRPQSESGTDNRPEKPRFLPEPITIDPAEALMGNIEADDAAGILDLVFLADGSIYADRYPFGDATGLKLAFKDDVTKPAELSPGFTMKTTKSTTFDRYVVYFSLFGKVSVHPYHS